jgi:hypothetical protein
MLLAILAMLDLDLVCAYCPNLWVIAANVTDR